MIDKQVAMKEIIEQMKEYGELYWTKLKVALFNGKDFIKNFFHYYSRSLVFTKIDLYLLCSYFFYNPFGISKQFYLDKEGKELFVYGETPLSTMDKIATACGISKKDTVFELGAGRGRVCFWLNQWIGCKVVGVEYIPEFIKRANLIKKKFNLCDIEFRLQDFSEMDFRGATVVYLYGTCLDDKQINMLIKKLKEVSVGTKIITVSYPLSDYSNDFTIMRKFTGTFTWGEADIYFQIRH